MSKIRKHSLTPLAIFLTPLVLGVTTLSPMHLSEPKTAAMIVFPINIATIPYVGIFVALLCVLWSRYVLFRWPLWWLTALSCIVSLAIWMTFWFGDAWLWMGTPMLHFLMIACASFAGPILFVTGLVILRGRGAWSVPAGQCIHCGYNLAGLEKDTLCPECGKTSGEERR